MLKSELIVLLLFCISVGIFLPSQVLASEYYDQDNDFSFDVYNDELNNDWYVLPQDELDKLMIDGSGDLIQGFAHQNGETTIFIKKHDKESDIAEQFETVLTSIQEVPEKKRDMDRLLRPIEIKMGSKILDYEYDVSEKKLLLLSKGTEDIILTKQNKKILEFKLENFDRINDPKNKNQYHIYETFSLSPDDDPSTELKKLPDSKVSDVLDSANDDNKKDLDYYFSMMLSPKVWLILGGVTLVTIVTFIFKK